jgi:hypothetical protein
MLKVIDVVRESLTYATAIGLAIYRHASSSWDRDGRNFSRDIARECIVTSYRILSRRTSIICECMGGNVIHTLYLRRGRGSVYIDRGRWHGRWRWSNRDSRWHGRDVDVEPIVVPVKRQHLQVIPFELLTFERPKDALESFFALGAKCRDNLVLTIVP